MRSWILPEQTTIITQRYENENIQKQYIVPLQCNDDMSTILADQYRTIKNCVTKFKPARGRKDVTDEKRQIPVSTQETIDSIHDMILDNRRFVLKCRHWVSHTNTFFISFIMNWKWKSYLKMATQISQSWSIANDTDNISVDLQSIYDYFNNITVNVIFF